MSEPDRLAMNRRWMDLCARLEIASDRTPEPSTIMDAYESPSRHYHNLKHINDCLRELDRVSGDYDDADALEAAIWFHDFIYDGTRGDNEERSAGEAMAVLGTAGVSSEKLRTIADLILATRHSSTSTTNDARVMVDIDLSILGQPRDIFDAYERAIRQEYAHVEEPAFRTGRANILRGFLSRRTIYSTARFQADYEAIARENLKRSIARLGR